MRLWRQHTAGMVISLAAAGAAAAEPAPAAGNDPFAFLQTTDTRPLATIIETDYANRIDVGFSYVSSDSYSFGQYNGLNQQGPDAYLNMDLSGLSQEGWLSGLVSEWRFIGEDLGLDTRTMQLSFGRPLDYQVLLSFDEQQQVLNDSGRTPYRGSNDQTLPANWVASNITSGMTELFAASRQFDQVLQRDRLRLALDKHLGAWRVSGAFSNEQKTGDQSYAGAIYVDGSNGHATVLQRPVDYTTRELDLNAAFAGSRLAVDLSYLYSSFDNADDQLRWQNPFAADFGPAVDYPAGAGQIALEPDNSMQRLRAVGSYILNPRLRLRFDSSYAWTEQNQDFLPFTVNNLPQQADLPRNDLNGEVTTGTFNSSLYYRPQALPKLTLEASYHFENRNNKSPRDGYLYVRGDAWAPEDDRFTVYNTPHERTVNRGELEASYRLPWRSSKLTLGYGYEQIERYNAAVSKTEENIFTVEFAFAPRSDVSARLTLDYGDRGASTYQWGRSFYALLDTELINEIPDNQRYITHPLLSQYYVANRERLRSQATVTWTPTQRWNLLADVSWSRNDYDQTDLGLQQDSLTHLTLSSGYQFSQDLSLNLFYSYDNYQARQTGRAFRGGIEKNAFDTVPPLAQASDPSRDWRVRPDDKTNSVGASVRWTTLGDRLEMEWEYSFYDASGKTDFTTFGAPDLTDTALPDNTSRQHQLRWTTSYHLREALSLNFEYQYYRFVSDDWALDGVGFTSLDRVVWTGQTSPSDVVHYFMISAQYRFHQ